MAIRFDNIIIERVQQANDIVDLISEHVNLNRKGKEMVGLCPFHEDHKPSLNVNPAKQIFKCFACGAGGDVFKFVQMRENLTFPQAVQRLAERAGIRIEPAGNKTRTDGTEQLDPNRLAKVNDWAAGIFLHNLYNTKKGKETLKYIEERKIPAESIKKWRLGLALDTGDDLIKNAKEKNIPLKLLQQAGLLVGSTGQFRDKFINRLMFTITDVTDRVIGFGGRTLDEKGAKYINSPATALFDKSKSVYGLQQARPAIVSDETAVVVEGYTDCIMAHAYGFENVVATLGTSFTAGHGFIIRRYAKKVILLFDGDTAGIEAANRALEVCLSQHLDIKIAFVPEGKDPCEYLLTAGKEKFEKLLTDAVDVFEYKWNRLEKKFDADQTFSGRKKALDEFLQTLAAGINSSRRKVMEQGLLVNRLATLLGLSRKQIRNEINKRMNTVRRTAAIYMENRKVAKLDITQGLLNEAQREILEVLINEPELYKNAKEEITIEFFDEPVLKQIAELLLEALKSEPRMPLNQLLSRTESVELAGYITELAQEGAEKGNFKLRLNKAVDSLLRQKEKRKIEGIKDKDKKFRKIAENAGKGNRHIIGMS